MRKKDGSLDKRFKENKGLENYDLSSAYSELAKLEQDLERQEIEEKVIKKTINNFLNLSNSSDIINEISDLTEYFILYSDFADRFGEEKQNLKWLRIEERHWLVIDSFVGGGIKWDGTYSVDEEEEHSVFITKFHRLEHLIGELIDLEQSVILEMKK